MIQKGGIIMHISNHEFRAQLDKAMELGLNLEITSSFFESIILYKEAH